MARTIWTGALSFGLVNVPVGLYSATEDKSVRFNQFQAGTSDRVRNKRINERTGDEVGYGDIVKGFDLGTGEHVIVTPDEIASVAPGKSRTIDVAAFVDLAEIDPVYFEEALLPGSSWHRRRPGLRPAARGHDQDEQGGHRQLHHARPGVPGHGAPLPRGARARDPAPGGRGP